jgi:transcription-repair coupling factor (superfamily II helicase)
MLRGRLRWRGGLFLFRSIMDTLKKIIPSIKNFQRLVESAGKLPAGKSIAVTGAEGSFASLLLGNLQQQVSKPLIVIAQDEQFAERYRDELDSDTGARLFTGHASRLTKSLTSSEAQENRSDNATLRLLIEGTVTILVIDPEALLVNLPPVNVVKTRHYSVTVGTEQAISETIEQLNTLGFEKTDFVQKSGDYALRGGILDAFPFSVENPIRIEFSGDSVESIREFDAVTQRSIRELSLATITSDLLANSTASESSANTILDFAHPDALLVLDEPELIRRSIEEAAKSSDSVGRSWSEVDDLISMFPQIHLVSSASKPKDTVSFNSNQQPSFNGSISFLKKNLHQLQSDGFEIVITCDSQSELARLKDLLAEDISGREFEESSAAAELDDDSSVDISTIQFSLEAMHAGFILPDSKFALYTEHQIFNRVKRRGKKRKAHARGFSRREVQLLRKGDYVVHFDYGIGRFDGLKKIKVKDIEQEAVKLLFEENDALYVNLNYLNKVQKYSSKEGHVPKLTKLGHGEWDRLKSKTKKRIKDIARDLIQLYARRKHEKGFAFSSDTSWQKELEASFMFEDTFDQAKATLDIKQDMEASHPMDRLICGDVGFGKTEVAVRAAFKAVLNGKQVAVLVPTTILAMQHYNTFTERTSRYSTHVQSLSRFKSKLEQTRIIEHLRAGTIDIVIGTHRLLSKDVGFKDLGLLIIDEEHRFGVAAKEKLRQLKANVDTLTLTATPIPRTLHFSLMGARDLSIIATPPRNRQPVITEMTQFNEELIREAVMKEVHRGGQVYFVHDRIHTIEELTARLTHMLPTVRVRFAHGQMHAHELENVMMAFVEKKFDVLVCTKIIESGLDMPNVNTIIINRADRFGMAELYQLRGRVGRSNLQAYAYLLIPPIAALPRETLLRLEAVEEFSELGSGFNLAMRDLEIRGAGNLLGGEQSGFIEAMGFEAYSRILEEAVNELKDSEFQGLFEEKKQSAKRIDSTMVETEFSALIPQAYIENDMERLEIYRRLYEVSTVEQLNEIRLELEDRFGQFPGELENLIGIIRIRLAAAVIGLKKVIVSLDKTVIEFPPETDKGFYESEAFQKMMARISQLASIGVRLKQEGGILRLTAAERGEQSEPRSIEHALGLLSKLSDYSEVANAAIVSPG